MPEVMRLAGTHVHVACFRPSVLSHGALLRDLVVRQHNPRAGSQSSGSRDRVYTLLMLLGVGTLDQIRPCENRRRVRGVCVRRKLHGL